MRNHKMILIFYPINTLQRKILSYIPFNFIQNFAGFYFFYIFSWLFKIPLYICSNELQQKYKLVVVSELSKS